MTETLPSAELEQVEEYEFRVTYPGEPYGPWIVDEPSPTGRDRGPGPVRALATAVGHCMSSTLVNTLARAHVPVTPLRTTVHVEVGRNDRGRLRVRRISLDVVTQPMDEADRARFDHCLSIFEDFCTVSGAVREGITIETRVTGPGA